MSNKKPILLLGGIGAVTGLAAIGAAIYLNVNSSDPKDIVFTAFKNVVSEEQISPLEDVFGITQILKTVEDSPVEVNGKLSVLNTSIEDSQLLNGAGSFVTLVSDPDKKTGSVNAGISYANMDLLNMQLYEDPSQISITLPDMTDKVITLYLDDLSGQIETSPFIGQKLREEGISPELIKIYMENVSTIKEDSKNLSDIPALWNRYKEEAEVVKEFKEAILIEKIDKREFIIDGDVEKCKGYHVIVPKDSVVLFLRSTKDFIFNDQDFINSFTDYCESANEMQNAMYQEMKKNMDQEYADYISEPEQLNADEVLKEADKKISEWIDTVETNAKDVISNVYVRKNGNLASFTVNTVYGNDDNSYGVYGECDFGGGYSQLSNLTGNLRITDPKSKTITISIDKNGSYNKEKEISDYGTISVNVGESEQIIVYDAIYKISDGSYSLKLECNADQDEFYSFSSTGTVKDITKGKSITINADHIKYEFSDTDSDEEEITGFVTLEGMCSVKPFSGTIEKPDGTEFNLLSATEEEFQTLVNEMLQRTMTGIISRASDKVGQIEIP